MIDCISTKESLALTPLAPVHRGEGLGVRGSGITSKSTSLRLENCKITLDASLPTAEYRARGERFTWGEVSPKNRHGVTLIELLTVLGIVTLVALLVLPSVKTMLTDRKSTNAATMVRNFLEAARARAVGSQIPVAVVLERISSVPLDSNNDGLIDGGDLVGGRLLSATSTDPLPAAPPALPLDTNFLPYNSCIRMSMAEQPLPITEKMLDGTPTIFSSDTRSLPTLPPGTPAGLSWAVLENVLSSSPLVTNYFVAGNEVSLGQSNIRHLIALTLVPAPPTNGQAGFVNHWFGVVGRNVIASNLEQAIPATDLAIPISGETRFTLFQKPKPINGPNIQLPKGMCIDLSLSGFSSVGNLSFTDGSGDFHDHDQRLRFSSAWVTGGLFVPSAQTLRPIYIVFSPDGSLSRVYANGVGSTNSIPIELADDLFLHIGKIDQVVLTPKRPATVSASPAVPENITDPSMYVVRLSSKSGGLSVAPATQGIPRTLEIGDVLELTRQGTYGASLTGQ